MFTSTLSCSAVALPEQDFNIYASVAKHWAGLEPEIDWSREFVSWREPTQIEIAEYPWFKDVSPIVVNTKRAIGRVGTLDGHDVVVAISAFSSVTAALKEHLHPDAEQVLDVDIGLFWKENHGRLGSLVRSLDCVRSDGLRLTVTATPGGAIPPLGDDFDLRAMLIIVGDREVTIGRNFDLKVQSIDANIADVAVCLKNTFDIFGPYTSLASVEIDVLRNVAVTRVAR